MSDKELKALRIASRKTAMMRQRHHETLLKFQGTPISEVFVELVEECDECLSVLSGMIEVRVPDWRLREREEDTVL